MISYDENNNLIIGNVTRDEYFNMSKETYSLLSPLEVVLLVEKYGEGLDFTVSFEDLCHRFDVDTSNVSDALLSKRFDEVYDTVKVSESKVYFNGSDGSRLILDTKRNILIFEYGTVNLHQSVYDSNGFEIETS